MNKLALLAIAGVALIIIAFFLVSDDDAKAPPTALPREPDRRVAERVDQPADQHIVQPVARRHGEQSEPPAPALPVPPAPLPALDDDGPPFPEDLDDRFREEELSRAVNDAIAKMEMQGEVVSVDCREYPCLVVAKVRGAIDAYSLRSVVKQYEHDNIWFYPGPAIGEARAVVVGWTPMSATSPDMKRRIKLRQQHGVASVSADDLKAFFR